MFSRRGALSTGGRSPDLISSARIPLASQLISILTIPIIGVGTPPETTKKHIPYKNRIPHRIVEIFERHGFIWGGKWYHYDTMHFEYRPELLRGRRNRRKLRSQELQNGEVISVFARRNARYISTARAY